MIERHLIREHRPKQIGRYYPSEVGNCLRKLWYSYKYPHYVEMRVLKIFEVGNMLHGFVVEVLKSNKNEEVELIKSELPFKIEMKNFVVSGRVDDLILVKRNNKKILVEVKSTKNVSRIEKPQSNHMLQLMFYMHATAVHDGIILYIDKNTLDSKVFEIKYDEQIGADMIDRFNYIHEHLVEGELPFAEAKQMKDMKWMCNFCEYREKCDKNSL